MLNQHDIEIIDDDLAAKENDGLHAFSKWHRHPSRVQLEARGWLCQEVGGDHRNHAGEHCSLDSQSEQNQQIGAPKPD